MAGVTTEIRWHARAGQGAKTAAHLLALGLLRSGSFAQAFPEYGPERRGAPLRAFTRASSRPIRRHDSVTTPDVVVVLEPSLLHEVDVAEGIADHGVVIVNAETVPDELAGYDVVPVPAGRASANLVLVGAVARVIGRPPLEELEEAAVEELGRKVPADDIRAALREGYACRS